jgi:hypothetical protein
LPHARRDKHACSRRREAATRALAGAHERDARPEIRRSHGTPHGAAPAGSQETAGNRPLLESNSTRATRERGHEEGRYLWRVKLEVGVVGRCHGLPAVCVRAPVRAAHARAAQPKRQGSNSFTAAGDSREETSVPKDRERGTPLEVHAAATHLVSDDAAAPVALSFEHLVR